MAMSKIMSSMALRRGLAAAPSSFMARRGFAGLAASANPFPSLTITRDGVTAQGSFAENQAQFLKPHDETARNLAKVLKEKNMGVVAHFYMDAELQGTLVKVKEEFGWEHVFCADSLAMSGAAVEMAEKGVSSIACLGVDFMSESCKAYLDQNGFENVPVFRLKEEHIGCSLAASAEKEAYAAYLRQGAERLENPLHVVYINTSLKTKADTHNIVPTITCTSSNVVSTILQATAEMPSVNILYGPDTYMGENLQQLFTTLAGQSDAEIQKLHPAHNVASINRLLSQFHYFKQGICVVHHMFGGEVTAKVQREYPLSDETYYTSHFEVPGEMFAIATSAQSEGRGVVGSTSNILNFITAKAAAPFEPGIEKKRFILGTEAGMITGIVKGVQETLRAKGGPPNEAIEIVFPVAEEAVAQSGDAAMPIVPGVAGGEGCSTAGGCANCPYMKMNDLDALVDLSEDMPLSLVANGPDHNVPLKMMGMQAKVPEGGRTPAGNDILDGTKPIAYMRHLMSEGKYNEELKTRVMSIGAGR